LEDFASTRRNGDEPCASEKSPATIWLIPAISSAGDEPAVRELGYRRSPLIALIELAERDALNLVELTGTGSGSGVGSGGELRADRCRLLTGDAYRNDREKER